MPLSLLGEYEIFPSGIVKVIDVIKQIESSQGSLVGRLYHRAGKGMCGLVYFFGQTKPWLVDFTHGKFVTRPTSQRTSLEMWTDIAYEAGDFRPGQDKKNLPRLVDMGGYYSLEQA